MKRLLVVFVLLLAFVTTSFAQEKRRFWIGGEFSYYEKDQDISNRKDKNYGLFPEFGYGLSDRLSIGLNLGYGYQKSTLGDASYYNKQKIKSYSVAPFVRYAYLKWKIVDLYVDGLIGYSRHDVEQYSNVDQTPSWNDDKRDTYNVGVRPGISVRITPHIALSASTGVFGFQHTKGNDTKTTSLRLNDTFSPSGLSFGFKYLF